MSDFSERPRAVVLIGDQQVPVEAVTRLHVSGNLYRAADAIEATFANDDLISDYLEKEMQIQAFLGWPTDPDRFSRSDLERVFFGKLDSIKPVFGMEMTCDIDGRDYTAPMLDTRNHFAFAGMSASQIAAKIMTRHPNLHTEIVGTTKRYDRSLHIERTEWEILQEIASQEIDDATGRSFVCYVDGLNFYFGPRKQDSKIVANLFYRMGPQSNVIEARFDDSTLHQYSKVTVRHWTKKKKIEGSAEDKALSEALGGVREKIFHRASLKSNAEAQKMAEAYLKKVSRGVVTGTIQVPGSPHYKSEMLISAHGMGRFDGEYYIEGAVHDFTMDGFITTLEVVSELPEDQRQYRKDLVESHGRTS